MEDAIADGLPIVKLGDPVFYEPLAVAFDKSVADNDSLVAAVDAIVGEMHADGTLSELSQKWYGIDLTKQGRGVVPFRATFGEERFPPLADPETVRR